MANNGAAIGEQLAPRRKKSIFKRKRFWIILIIVLGIIGAGFYFLSPKPATTQYTTEAAAITNLVQTVSATGAVESANDISLSFQAPGKLTVVKVKEGDIVKAGTLLAEVDSASFSATISQQQANLNAARAVLARVKGGASSQDVNLSQEQVNKASDDLQSLETQSQQQLQTLRQNNLNAISNSQFVAGVALNKIYNYFINTNNINNLQVSDSSLFNAIGSDYARIKKDIDQAQVLIAAAQAQKTDDTILAASNDLLGHLTDLNSLLDKSFKLGDSIIVNSSYPQTVKDAIKADISNQQTAAQGALSSLQLASTNLSSNITSYNSQIQSAQNALTIAQAQLSLKQAPPRDFDIQSAQAQVAQAQAQLDQANANAANYRIVAPIDGQVVKVNYKLGEQVPVGQTMIEMLSSGNYQIKVDISESDIAKVIVGNKAQINLDAFGSDHIFTGAVVFIDPAQTAIQDVVYYKATITINSDDWNSKIKPGMSANVTITTAQKNNVLTIPQRAVTIGTTTLGETPVKTVQILVDTKNNKIESRTVTTGLQGDGGYVEVLSGINVGDKVVTFTKTQ